MASMVSMVSMASMASMMTRRSSILAALVLATASSSWAQQPQRDRGVLLSGVVAATTSDFDTHFTFGGSIGYRFQPHVGVVLDVSYIPDLAPDLQALSFPFPLGDLASPPFDFPRLTIEGRALFLTANVRAEIATKLPWLVPYVSVGGGVARVKQEIRFGPFSFNGLLPSPLHFDESDTDTSPTLSLGGGVGLRLVGGLSFDGEIRYFRVAGRYDLNLTRFGTGVTYRFGVKQR